MAIGAYSCTYFSTQWGITYWLSLPLGGALAAIFGFILGFPALRVRGFYLAVVTLGFLSITQIFIEQVPSITGGVRGVSVPRPSIFGLQLSSDLAFYYVVLFFMIISAWCAYSLLKSPTGRAFNAIRNSEAAAQTLGVSLSRTKLIAFVIAAFYAGVGGGLYASLVGFIDPLEFGVWTSIRHVVFIVVGGLGSVTGSIIGAATLTVLPEILRGFKEYNEFVFGGLLLLVLMVMPHGLVGLASTVRRLAHWRPRKAYDEIGRAFK
jgi:branched-chain amino acid transport system permease protein